MSNAIPYFSADSFGFNNDDSVMEGARQWIAAAVADGWVQTPTYGESEGIDRACTLTRDGYIVQAITRTRRDGDRSSWKHESNIHMWGPDGLQIKVPAFYDFAEIVARTRQCSNCGAKDVDTQRYSFAGRCCATCRPIMAERTERDNWTE